MRARIKQMQDAGSGDQEIVSTIVKEQGVVALAAPPAEGWGLFTWVMPGVALLLGFLFYSWWVRHNRQEPQAAKDIDQNLIDRFRDQIESELGESVDQTNRNGNTGRR
jgi:cytochrome c-type biogenesis protein CcmH/NrfF